MNPRALDGDRIELTLFDDVHVTARRSSRSHPRMGSTLWQGTLEAPDRGDVALASVDGVLSGTVTVEGRLFEIGFAGGGLHEIRELSPALFPSEAFPEEPLDLVSSSGSGTVSTTTSTSTDPANRIDVMVVWTPAARTAAGGSAAAIQSVIDLAIANANNSYAHSLIGSTLRLVYSGEVDFVETPSGISTDVARLAGTADGYVDQVHSLRNQHGADIVTLLGSGYAKAGYCGVGYLMSTVSTNFASKAFNIVDQSCATGHLSYAHEVGHNQGLQHDPANAGSTPSHPYAYGYQDTSGAFRTVMAYGSAVRIQRLSNPGVFYNGKPTGTTSQNNAQALNNNLATVANFRTSSTSTSCSYTVSPTSMTFSETGGTVSMQVSTNAGCAWTTSSGASWVSAGPGGSGSGSVVVSVASNAGDQRTATLTIAGVAATITQAAHPMSTTPPAPPASCSFGVSPTSFTIPGTGATFEVSVTTEAGCAWTVTSHTGWLKVTGGGSGSGTATLQLSATNGSRTASATIAGETVTVTQTGSRSK